MTLEEEHEHNLIALDEKSRELRRHQGICRRAHEMIVDGDYELRSLLDLLASSWRKGKPAGMTPNGPAWKIGGYERREDALRASSTPHAGVQPVRRTFPAGDWRSARLDPRSLRHLACRRL